MHKTRLFMHSLLELRRSRGRSQLRLALDANVSARHISFLETGRAQPTRAMVLKLARALGASSSVRNRLLLDAGFAAPVDAEALVGGSCGCAAAADVIGRALEIQRAASVEGAMSTAAAALEQFGLTHFFTGVLSPARANHPLTISIEGGGRPPLAWLTHYRERAYRAEDPLVQATARSRTPFFWSDVLARSRRLARTQRRMFAEAAEFGIANGFVVPVHWPDRRVHAVSSMGRYVDDDPAVRIKARVVCTALLERIEELREVAQFERTAAGD